MSPADHFIDHVLARLPRAMPRRAQIALELRGHIAERLAEGQPVDLVLRQLGDPAALAESFLDAVALEPASWSARALAKTLDVGLVLALVVPLASLAWFSPSEQVRASAVVAAFIAGFVGFLLYTVLAEWRLGHTWGKRAAGLAVVRETGASVSLGQAVVRQLPVLLQVFWIDALFILFTDRRQRAFELLSKTRVVRADAWEPPADA